MPELIDVVPLMSTVVDGIARVIEAHTEEPPFQRDDAFVAEHVERLDRILAMFGPTVMGLDHLPASGPYLLVGNHSGGIYTPCMWAFLSQWYRHIGLETPAYFLVYDMVFALPGVGGLYRRMGGMPASEKNARAVFAKHAPLLVYPGGDYEAFRPWGDREVVDFGGRKGFITLALKHRIPVIPVTAAGSHATTYVLTRGETLAEAMGLHRMRVKIFPFTLGFPFGITPGFVPQMPLPSKISIDVGRPLDWLQRYPARQAHDPKVLRTCYDEIVGTMQHTMDRLNTHMH